MIRSIVLKMSGIPNDDKNTKIMTEVNLSGNDQRTNGPPIKFTKPQGPGAGWGFNELNQEVRHRQGGWGHSLDHPPCSDKSQNSGFLRKSIFLILGAPKKLF